MVHGTGCSVAMHSCEVPAPLTKRKSASARPRPKLTEVMDRPPVISVMDFAFIKKAAPDRSCSSYAISISLSRGPTMFSYRPLFRFGHKRRFDELSEREVLALAISSEEEDGAIYSAYAEKLRPDFPASAAVFEGMSAEEDGHRKALIDLYRSRFGEFIVPIRREHVADFIVRSPVWLVENLEHRAHPPGSSRHGARGPGFLPARRQPLRPTQRPASCWAIWPPPRRATSRRRSIWRTNISAATPATRRIRRRNASSS